MFSIQEIDEMVSLLEAKLPGWAGTCDESQFLRLLSGAVEYMAAGACREAQLHCLKRTGCMVTNTRQTWACQKGRSDGGAPSGDLSAGSG